MTWDSSKIDLAGLRVRETLLPFEEYEYRISRTVCLERPRAPLQIEPDFLRQRRTIREFGPISIAELAPFLWHAAHTCDVIDGVYGTVELRPSPSAGARHPIDLVLVDIRRAEVFVYRHRLHSLDQIQSDPAELAKLTNAAGKVLDLGMGFLVWLVAQPSRTLAKYEGGEGFVLLDAGALVATLSFSAHATNLSYSAIGISGEPWIGRLLQSQGKAVGILGGVVGTYLTKRQRHP